MGTMLTGREQDVLEAIREHCTKHGLSPSPRDIMTRLGVKTIGDVSKYITRLESYGYVKRIGSILERKIELTGGGEKLQKTIIEEPLKPIPLGEKLTRIRQAVGYYEY